MDAWMELTLLGKVTLAVVLGGIVGLEREVRHKAAGLRTHMLVTGAAALFTCLGELLIRYYATLASPSLVQADPTRIIQAIAVGIGFIGAGTIIQREEEERVKNLTTASSILFTSGIGIATGLGSYYLAAGGTVLALIVNSALGTVEKRYKSRRKERIEAE